MNLNSEYVIPVPMPLVWQGMNDPDLLKRCIAACESFEKLSDTWFVAALRFRLGPFKVRFVIDIAIENAQPPCSYRLVAEGKGGFAGFGKGVADVILHEEEDGKTVLSFTSHGEFQGAVARLAAKAMEGTAKRYADEFFAVFSREVCLAQKTNDVIFG